MAPPRSASSARWTTSAPGPGPERVDRGMADVEDRPGPVGYHQEVQGDEVVAPLLEDPGTVPARLQPVAGPGDAGVGHVARHVDPRAEHDILGERAVRLLQEDAGVDRGPRPLVDGEIVADVPREGGRRRVVQAERGRSERPAAPEDGRLRRGARRGEDRKSTR